ncbi:GNAT family N-acetyltransferase [Nonomuraea sp. NN258]|uniref:GNAT family N-acetyltransferase n=1 Tax=Nonomuraea antri TaxID=2730852 RepID=UPI0015687786|nr:GNAT family N-acetyltransferase [Nonomuraea antri]NRQ33469.1 GNAT family N-acetyltransferase [Nonomuraea antri]
MAIRNFRSGDEPALYDVCLRTGANGGDASSIYRNGRLLGEVFVGPYVALEPELAFVLDDGAGPEGYILGALDTPAFDAECEERWWPRLRENYPLESVAPDVPDRWIVEWIHRPPAVVPPAVTAAYPSHLHIDVLPRWQGGGWGVKLMNTLLDALTERGSTGVHLGVSTGNPRAIAFYRKFGFEELDSRHGALFLGYRLNDGERNR